MPPEPNDLLDGIALGAGFIGILFILLLLCRDRR